MLADLELSDRLEGGVRPAAAVGWLPLSAVPGDKRHLVEPLVGLEPRVADLPLPVLGLRVDVVGLTLGSSLPFLGRLRAPEEGSEGGVEPAEGLLLGGEGVPSLPVRSASRISRSWADWSP
jgi:hypothetical protein